MPNHTPEGQRSANKLKVLVKAKGLAKHTVHICSNQKVFTPNYYEASTKDLIKISKDIYALLTEANDIRVDNVEKKQRRQLIQSRALNLCRRMKAEIEIAHALFHLKSKKIKHWNDLVSEVRSLIIAWMESDSKRYKCIE